jgi:hypothetical protein
MTDSLPVRKTNGRGRIRLGLGATILGFVIYLLGAEPGLFRLDRSPVVGFVQIATTLVGLGIICLGGYISLAALWNGGQKSIASDIGLRMVSTGYVISVACGMADVFGFGTNIYPAYPVFGIYQQIGFMLGELVIGIGLLLLIPYKKPKPSIGELHT